MKKQPVSACSEKIITFVGSLGGKEITTNFFVLSSRRLHITKLVLSQRKNDMPTEVL